MLLYFLYINLCIKYVIWFIKFSYYLYMRIIRNEWVYLCKVENNQTLYKLIVDQLLNPLISASIRYLKMYSQDIIKYEDLKSICYESIILTIKTYDLNNIKYNFNQALFMINRSNIRNHLQPYLNNLGEVILSIAYSYDDSLKNFRIYDIKDDKNVDSSLHYNELKKLVNKALEHYSINDQEIFWDKQKGLSYDELSKKYNLKKSTITNRLNSMRSCIRDYLNFINKNMNH